MRQDERKRAELIFLGGNVLTMEGEEPAARAVAVADGRFIAVGEDEEVLRTGGESTVVEDLGGATVLPGFIDSHVHPDAVGRVLSDADLYDVRSIAEILEKLWAHARKVGGLIDEPGAVVGRADCLHPTSLLEGRLPTSKDLDRIATDRTVAITDVNKTIVNSFTLEQLGIADDASPPPGGLIGRDPESGRMDGTFYYAAKAMTPLGAQNASGADVPLEDALVAAAEAMVAAGITSAVFPGAGVETIEALRGLAARGRLPLRVTVMPPISLLDDEGALERAGLKCGAGTDMIRTGPLKIFYDRFLMHRTALMYEPFLMHTRGEPTPNLSASRGTPFMTETRTSKGLADIVRRAEAAGWAVAVHVTGDRGLDEVVEAITNAPDGLATRAPLACPHHVIHAYFPTRRSLDRMAEAGIAAAVQPQFHRAWGETVREFVGEERAAGFMALRAYLEAGVTCGGGSDGPITHFRPGLGMHPAVTRLTAAGEVLGEEQALTAAEALRLYTLGSAGVTGEAAQKGSIRPGKLADMIVLERDPLLAAPDDLLDLRVARTIVGGRTVFDEGRVR